MASNAVETGKWCAQRKRGLRFVAALLPATILAAFGSTPAQAEDLVSALRKTITNSPTLASRRAALAARSEAIVLARREGRPTVTSFLGLTENVRYQLPSVFNPNRRTRADLTVEVPLFLGGRVRNAVAAEQLSYSSDWAETRFSTTELLQETVLAYANILRDEAVAALAATEVDNLEMSYLTARARFRIGDLTATDVAQSTARLALARAERSDALATLARSREEYIAVVGDTPVGLEQPSFRFTFPPDEREAIKLALTRNDALEAVRYRIRSAEWRVKAAKSEREPKVFATSAVRYFNYLNSITADLPFPPRQEGTAVDVGVTLEIPLYQGGAPAALVRQATSEMMSSREEEVAIERAVVGRVRTAYATLRNLIVESEQAAVAVEANQEAVRGTQLEHELGTRTLLDLLDAKKELLQSQIIALTIERDRIVAEFVLAAALGNASPIDLGLVEGSDPDFTGPPTPRGSWSDWADGALVRPLQGTRTIDIEAPREGGLTDVGHRQDVIAPQAPPLDRKK